MTEIKTLDGGFITVAAEAIAGLDAAIRGGVSEPGAPGYDDARIIWTLSPFTTI